MRLIYLFSALIIRNYLPLTKHSSPYHLPVYLIKKQKTVLQEQIYTDLLSTIWKSSQTMRKLVTRGKKTPDIRYIQLLV